MNLFVKICGMTSLEDALFAAEAGADAVGFIVYPQSKRYIPLEKIAEIAPHLPASLVKVLVGVDWTLETVEAAEKIWTPDIFQLHGHESSEEMKELQPRRLWKALGLPWTGPDPASYDVEAILADKASPAYGGTGETFDWNLAVELKKSTGRPMLLSGGLNPNNVVEALQRVQPWGVDVASGVEAAPGRKDPEKVKEFISLCRSYQNQP